MAVYLRTLDNIGVRPGNPPIAIAFPASGGVHFTNTMI